MKISKSFVITIPHHTRRMAAFNTQSWGNLGSTLRAWPGFDPYMLHVMHHDRGGCYVNCGDPDWMMGCFISHLTLLQHIALGDDEGPFLVFEDDAVICDAFPDKIAAIKDEDFPKDELFQLCQIEGPFLWCTGYALTRQTAALMLPGLRSRLTHIDLQVRYMEQCKAIKIRYATKVLVWGADRGKPPQAV